MNVSNENGLVHWSGTTQQSRFPKALAPEYIQIDERKLSDLLAFACKYSDLVHFYSVNNDLDGVWSRFFRRDISIFLSSLIATNLRRLDSEHTKILQQLDNAPRMEDRLNALEELSAQILRLAEQINDWYVQALDMNRNNPMMSNDLENELESAIKQQLSKQLNILLDYNRVLNFHRMGQYQEDNLRDRFHDIWFQNIELDELQDQANTNAGGEQKVRYYMKRMRLLYRTFYSVTSYIIQVAPKILEQSLQEKDDHRPDMAMMVLFVKLFAHLQEQLNTITAKHLDFYYYDVLRQTERKHSSDKVHVFFDLSQHVDNFLLKKGTLLNAGRGPNGEELTYSTNEDLVLNRGKIASLKTLFVSKNQKIGIGSSYRLITNIYAAPIANSRDGQGARFLNNEENWPSFGEELLEKGEADRQMTYAPVGWALSAPILELEEGHRIISLRLEFDPDTMYTLNLLMKDLSKNLNISKEDAFSKIFRTSIQVFFSTTEGWTEAASTELLPPNDWNIPEITLVATMRVSDPAIIGYDHETMYDPNLGGKFDTRYPVMKIIHRNENTIYSYSFLKDLGLQKIIIDVHVKGLKRLDLSSDLGALESSMPFQPFGPVPRVGSYLLVGKGELFKKDLTDLKFNLEWHNLPDHKRGLRGYYKEYGLGIQNDSHRIRITALSDGQFYPSKESGTVMEYRLFTDDPQQPSRLAETTEFGEMDLSVFNIKPSYDFQMPPAFNSETRTGYFKIELVSPKPAFGHDDFGSIYTKIITHNASMTKGDQPDLPLPKQPFTPTIRTLSIDYSATAQVNVVSVGTISRGAAAPEQIYHLHPFGIVRTFHKGQCHNRRLLPTYEDDAYLLIAIKDLDPPCPLSIYFELREQLNLFTMNLWEAKPEIVWSYLSKNEWKEFNQSAVLTDTTYNFNNSGIVVLDLPQDMTKKNDVFPNPDCHWLRVTLRGDASRMPRALRVATQAVSATWVPKDGQDEHLATALEPKRITALTRSTSEIRGVHQPFGSFGGRPEERRPEFYTRISERLRHKNRAVSLWDFERIILDKFPSVYQVKCIPHLNNEQFVKKGSVVLVVVPRITPDRKGELPVVNPTILQTIKEEMAPMTSPFTNIEVRNPVYERVKITCGVRFTKGKNTGIFLKKLNEEIMDFMCPWMSGKESEMDLGGSFSKDMILSFIEKRSYVEFVTRFSAVQVYHSTAIGFDVQDTAIDQSNSPTLQATTPWSVLIPFETNPIYLMDETVFQNPEKSAINSMIISGDFVMTEEKQNELNTFLEQFDESKKRKKKDEEED